MIQKFETFINEDINFSILSKINKELEKTNLEKSGLIPIIKDLKTKCPLGIEGEDLYTLKTLHFFINKAIEYDLMYFKNKKYPEGTILYNDSKLNEEMGNVIMPEIDGENGSGDVFDDNIVNKENKSFNFLTRKQLKEIADKARNKELNENIDEDLLDNYVEKNWDKCWNICKKFKLTNGLSKSEIKRSRPGIVSMLIYDLLNAEKISYEELIKESFILNFETFINESTDKSQYRKNLKLIDFLNWLTGGEIDLTLFDIFTINGENFYTMKENYEEWEKWARNWYNYFVDNKNKIIHFYWNQYKSKEKKYKLEFKIEDNIFKLDVFGLYKDDYINKDDIKKLNNIK